MKILLIFDQGLAGAGGKSNPNVGLQIAKGGVGSALMLQPFFEPIGGNVVATLYCGNEYFLAHKEEVVLKMTKMAEKIKPDIVLCGPCFNFYDYALMSAMITEQIQKESDIPVVTIMSQENTETIEQYKGEIPILKMPKKGGTGLSDSFRDLAAWMKAKVEGQNPASLEERIRY